MTDKNWDIRNRYKTVTGHLERENAALHLCCFPSFILGGKKHDYSLEEKQAQAIRVAVLAAIRTGYSCELLQYNETDDIVPIDEDIALILKSLWMGDVSPTKECREVDALRLVLSCCAEYTQLIFSHWKNLYGPIPNLASYSLSVLRLLETAANEYFEMNDTNATQAVLLDLYDISKECLLPQSQAIMVSSIINRLADISPSLACEIGTASEHLFLNSADDNAADFYWGYACASEQDEDEEKAEELYQKCYEIREHMQGIGNWYTELTYSRLSRCNRSLYGIPLNYERLFNFIDNILNGVYDSIDPRYLTREVASTLYLVLCDQSNIHDFNRYDAYLSKYEQLCKENVESSQPMLNPRVATNLRGGYYLQRGQVLMAEQCFLSALHYNSASHEPVIVNDAQIKLNLLITYQLQNDLQSALPLVYELFEILSSDENNEILSERDALRVVAISEAIFSQSGDSLEEYDINYMQGFVDQFVKESLITEEEYFSPEEKTALVGLCTFIFRMLQCNTLNRQKCAQYSELLNCSGVQALTKHVNAAQKVLLFQTQFYLNRELGKIEEARSNIHDCLMALDGPEIPDLNRASILQTAGSFYIENDSIKIGYDYLKQSLNKLTDSWQTQVRYLNDYRLSAILEPLQYVFSAAYSSLRAIISVQQAYEIILQYKMLASLAGRERNRIINLDSTLCSNPLITQIHELQDQISALQSRSTLSDSSDQLTKFKEEERQLENEFAVNFKSINSFVSIDLSKFESAMPNDSSILEYYCYPKSENNSNFSRMAQSIDIGTTFSIDLYVIIKSTQKISIHRIVIPDCDTILEDSRTLSTILQTQNGNRSSLSEILERERISSFLFQSLIAPALDYISYSSTLFIAPDLSLINVPLELLKGPSGNSLQDNHTIIKLECGRDLIFSNNSSFSGGNRSGIPLLLGDPKYRLFERNLTKDISEEQEDRSSDLDEKEHIPSLPFSGEEVKRVARMCGGKCFTGINATKARFLSPEPHNIIHVATHGRIIENKGAYLYPVELLFAGAEDWFITKTITSKYGNGIITADEISRMDLSSVELVVISACFSGMSTINITRGYSGLISAFAAAGVKYVISNLWSADDFCSAVFMEDFYAAYLLEGNPPPIALQIAKKRLQAKKISDLENSGWFEAAYHLALSDRQKEIIRLLESSSKERRPFSSEKYWGGYACHLCN